MPNELRKVQQLQSTLIETQGWGIIFAAWLMSLGGMLGSLFFSEVMKLAPCVLCWYQRICLYPLVAILAIGFAKRDNRVTRYSWPFAIGGLFLALYHNLIYYGIIPESLSPCTGGVSCATPQLTGMGFVSIPLLSLLGFVVITALLLSFAGKLKRSLG